MEYAQRITLFGFYIKPQPNCQRFGKRFLLFLIWILHQTTTDLLKANNYDVLFLIWILHQTTTKNAVSLVVPQLFLIWILHQTTTSWGSDISSRLLFLIWILHQTTTSGIILVDFMRFICLYCVKKSTVSLRRSRFDAIFSFLPYFKEQI